MPKPIHFAERKAELFFRRLGENIHANPDYVASTRERHFSAGTSLYSGTLKYSIIKHIRNRLHALMNRFALTAM